MNLEIFNKPDPSGSMSKESFLMKNHPEEHNFILNYVELNDLVNVSFKEKVYLSINGIKNIPVCKNINCGKSVKYRNMTLGYREYCSTKCISSDPNIIKLKESKSLIKFGTKTPAESNQVKEKIIKTNQERYGANSAMCNKDVQEKSKQTLMLNYGVDNPGKSDEILKNRIESFKENIDQYKNSYKKTSLDRYGVEHPWMNRDIHHKTIDFFYKDYKERIEAKIVGKNVEFIGFEMEKSTNLLFKCNECGLNFNILTYQFYYRINNLNSICTKCFPISESSSIDQVELFNFIGKNYKGEILSNIKNIINPYEIDIYLPELKIGFEFNGIFWHSDKFKDKNYHLKKYNLSIDRGVNLYTIWEDDWTIKRDICESFILNKIGRTISKIYARKCEFREIDYVDSRKFLNNNHLQGDCKSSVRIGLFYMNELVSLMTFSKLRLPLQRLEKNRNKNKHYELTRFCNRLNVSVIGGASKMLKYFIDKYNPIQIETYSDNLISNGNLYQKLGFEYKHTSNPGYWYSIDSIREHRFNWRKQKLVKMGHDVLKTEEEIMSELGHYRIYNAGNKKWIYKIRDVTI
jgi:hypothetical protein